jgi:predicted TIM-barrel fold metal-dependent hydrolase
MPHLQKLETGGSQQVKRRNFLMVSGAALSYGAGALRAQQPAGRAVAKAAQEQQSPQQDISAEALLLKDYQPRSIHKIPVTTVEKAKYPVIDMHNHGIRQASGAQGVAGMIKAMDALNFEKTIVLSWEARADRFATVAEAYLKYPGRFELWGQFDLSGIDQPGFEGKALAALEALHRAGSVGIGELVDRGRGLTVVEMNSLASSPMGPHPDDPRLDPLFDRCAKLGMPINLHVGHPIWCYYSQNQFNDGLMNSFVWRLDDKPGVVGQDDMLASLENVAKKHPKTVFVIAHMADLVHDLTRLGQIFDRHPNVYADLGARFQETAATPRAVYRFLQKYPDRVVYGTDFDYHTEAIRNTFRILETEDEHFYYHHQYHWPLHAFGLPDPILKKVYRDNALRVLKQARG